MHRSTSLRWVDAEIRQVLKSARQALEEVAEGSAAPDRLAGMTASLHEIRGLLELLEVYGAAMLAEEMEALAQGLVAGDVDQTEDAYEILMRAMLQLPEYLERLQTGRADNPMLVMPLLNDLRAVRRQPLLSENAVFSPDLYVVISGQPASVMSAGKVTPEAFHAYIRRLRPYYQKGLVDWYRGRDARGGLSLMASVIQHLERVAGDAPMGRLWWIAAGTVEALRDGAMEPSVSVKLLLGQTDRQIKRLLDAGPAVLHEDPPRELLKNLLYYLARCNAPGARAREVRRVFRLEGLIPDEQATPGPSGSLGPDRETWQTVSAAIQEDLARVKDTLDFFVRTESTSMVDLEPVVDVLERVADTLGLLGLGSPRKAVQDQITSIRGIVATGTPPSQDTLLDIAGALLEVDTALEAVSTDGPGEDHPASAWPLAHSGPGEQERLAAAVAREAKTELAAVKEAVSSYLLRSAPSLLDPARGHFDRVAGSLSMLSLERAANLLRGCARFVEQLPRNQPPSASDPRVEHFADALVGIETYLEAMVEVRTDSASILDTVERSLAAADRRETAVDEPAQDVAATSPEAARADVSSPPVATLEPLPSSVAESLRHAREVLERLDSADAAAVQAAPTPSEAALAIAADQEVPELAEEPSQDTQAPGAGRTANAGAPAELVEATETPEAFESEDRLEPPASAPSPDAAEPGVKQTPQATPQALQPPQATGVATAPEATQSTLEETPPPVGEAEPAREGPVAPTRPYGGAGPEAVDPEIVEIFLEELEEVLQAMGEDLRALRADAGDNAALVSLRRAFHTVKGSGRLVGAVVVGELAWAVEAMLNRVLDGLIPYSSAMGDLAGEVRERLPELVSSFTQGRPAPDDIQTLMDRAHALAQPSIGHTGEKEPSAGGGGTAEGPEEAAPATAAPAGRQAEIEREEPPGPDGPEPPAEPDEQGEPAPVPPSERVQETTQTSAAIELQAPLGEASPLPDRVLLDIFRDEAGGHLKTLREFLARADGAGYEVPAVTRKLLRACHTLRGSAEVAAVPAVALVFGTLENALATMAREGKGLDRGAQATLGQTAELLAGTLQELEGGLPPAHQDQACLLAEIESMAAVTGPAPADDATPDLVAGELLDVFVQEAEELLDQCDGLLRRWQAGEADPDVLGELQRCLHTLKGGARMAELSALGDLSHAMESVVALAARGALADHARLQSLVQRCDDRLSEMVEAVRGHRQPAQADDLMGEIDALLAQGQSPVAVEPAAPPASEVGLAEPASLPERLPRDKEERVQVRATSLDTLVSYAGEISISRSRLEQQMGNFRFNLEEMDRTLSRLREQLRRLEIEAESQILFRYESQDTAQQDAFDPLELDRFSQMQQLSRGLLESVSDLESVGTLLGDLTRDSESILVQQGRLNTSLQRGLMDTRLLPVARYLPRLRRVVRQTAAQVGKKVELHVTGQEEELDHTILSRMVAPLEHMLRNAVDHGLEPVQERLAKGKPELGQIQLSVYRDGSEAVFRLRDDGRGFDLEAIRSKAVERGLVGADSGLRDDELVQFVFEQAFSTAAQVTQISGRGVGLDVVSNAVKQLGGSLRVDTLQGQGCEFAIRVPTTLSVAQALMVEVGEQTYAVPLASIGAITRLPREQLMALMNVEMPLLEYLGESYRVANLGMLLETNKPETMNARSRFPVLLARAGGHHMALVVESLSGRQEIVMKPLGPQLSAVRWIAGGTILGDGRVVLILDIPALVRKSVAQPVSARGAEPAPAAVAGAPRRPLIMVVDDSITVRKVTQRFLQRHGMDVLLAKDGVEALGLLQRQRPDLILLDIEMPRMDGYELATTVRNDSRLGDVPIIMITSRTGQRHSAHAKKIGVNRYMGKPYHEQELLDHIDHVLRGGP